LQLLELDLTPEACLQRRLLGLHSGSHTTDVERTHGQLRTRLTNGLSGNDAHSLTHVHHVAARQVTAVAIGADSTERFTGEYGANLDPLKARLFGETDLVLVEHASLVADHLVGPGT